MLALEMRRKRFGVSSIGEAMKPQTDARSVRPGRRHVLRLDAIAVPPAELGDDREVFHAADVVGQSHLVRKLLVYPSALGVRALMFSWLAYLSGSCKS